MQPMRRRGPKRAGAVLTDEDVHLFNEGTHDRAYLKLGSHPATREGEDGTAFAVWAPGAARVSVVGEFNGWKADRHPLRLRGQSGLFEGFVPGVGPGAVYKYHVASRLGGYEVDKADPFAFRHETPPRTGSVVWGLDYAWGDREWMGERGKHQTLSAPGSTYEVHLGSWRRDPGQPGRFLTYRELAPALADHVEEMGFTHVELLPVMEHPFYGSWGYQSLGYFAPTSRQGTPQDLMHLVDTLHQRGIGVIFDWVPSHFPTDEHGLAYFDGTHLYEHADRRQGHHPDWDSFIFNYGRHEVRSFLLSSAMFWLDVFHADGLRVDAVASMLYLDYSRKAGEWIPNAHGGRENLEAISFLRRLNEDVYREHPDVQTVAEESTAWPMVSRPLYVGGLGFGLKWDMGWMHDTLAYFARDPVFRKFHHNELTFRTMYAFDRELRAAPLPRRGRARQGVAARQDAGGRVAEARQPAPPLRLDVGPARQEAPLHGRRDRPVARVEPRPRPRLAPPRPRAAPRAAGLGPGPEPPLPRASPRSTSGTASPAASSGWTATTRRRAFSPSCVAGARPRTWCSWPATSPRSRGPATAWASPRTAAGGSS